MITVWSRKIEMIETTGGPMTYEEWCKKETARINASIQASGEEEGKCAVVYRKDGTCCICGAENA